MLADILELKYDAKLAEVEARHEARHEERLMAEKRAMARNFKNDGVPVEVIARNTGFTIAEIEKL
ncbi:MAG: hypothetical protein FWC89_09465 [Defluviitaleaceae bacterium]|nr:hypothetical protein [Defluviitaleaceae bacterium]